MFLNKLLNTYTFSITGTRREYFAEKLKRLVHLAPNEQVFLDTVFDYEDDRGLLRKIDSCLLTD
ncbi:hypothetical protein J21TS7_53110 [Paenibacillus cineris]|uniref:Uncharacterized protein n=1 Tax=Paenibacillus cineris TaxID=237530 RepID=A0ABQ4LKE5_9BACL|nr:hypothetical protein J21TS7_53110 [Paenibacillus cineris]